MEEENKEKEKKTIKKGNFVKKTLKVLLYIVVAFFVLNSILYGVLSIPFVQNKLVRFASQHLSTMLKTEVTVSEVRFSLFNRASFRGLYIEDLSSDTLVYAEYINARIKPIDFLFYRQLRISELELDDFQVNITAADSISSYNFQFIIDAFSSSDSIATDTVSNPLDLVIDDVKITNGKLGYRIQSDATTPHLFNPSDVYITDFNANVSIYSIDMKKLDIDIHSITAKEKSGLKITTLQGRVLSEGSQLRVENLLFKLPNSYFKPTSLFYDLESQEFEMITEEAEISPLDLIPLLDNFKYLEHNLSLKMALKGKLPLVDATKIDILYGNDAMLQGSAFISTYKNLNKADIRVDVTELSATPKGLVSLVRLSDQTFAAPSVLAQLGRISLNAQLKGKLENLNLTSKVSMETGTLSLLANGKIDTTFTNFDVKAKLNTKNFNLAPIVGQGGGVGKLSMAVDVDARQKGEGNMVAKMKGRVESLQLMDGSVSDLPFEGYYDKHKMSLGADAKLHFGRIMAGFEMTRAAKPDIKLALNLSDLNVAYFYKNELWDKPILDFKIRGQIKKFDIDNLDGDISIKDLRFVDKDFDYQPGLIALKAWQDTAEVKHIALSSSILSANMEGDYQFSTLGDEVSDLMHSYLSNVFPATKKQIGEANDFKFNVKVNNSEELSSIFDLPFTIIEPLELDGMINTKQRTIDVVGQLAYTKNKMMDIRGVRLNVSTMDSTFNIKLDADLNVDKSRYNVGLSVNGFNNSMQSVFSVDSDSAKMKIKGQLGVLGQFTIDEDKDLVSSFQIVPSDVQIGSFAMNLLAAKILNVKGRTEVENFGIGINKKKYLDISGTISDQKEDSLRINFNKAQVADILQGLSINDIQAEINGNILATNILSTPELYTRNLQIKNIVFYNDTLGTINIDTRWNSEMQGIKLESTLMQKGETVMSIEGLVDPSKETLDLEMDVERFSISWLKPFMDGLLSDISGDISSHFTIKGKFDEPITEGFFGFNNTKIAIDYTNVAYYISDTIKITPDRIGFDNLTLTDSEGNQGVVTARLTHQNFQNMKYSLDMRTQNLLVLNTQSRTDSLFYGKLFASGTVKLEGSDAGINLDLQLKNGKKSNLNVTIPQVSEAAEYKSVVYINVPLDKLPKEDGKKKTTKKLDFPVKIKMRLDVNPDIELGVVIDPQTGDRMNIKGNGIVDFNYELMTGNMTIFGDYKATDGGVRLNLQNISKLEFKIKEGSKLNFIGDPLKTKFDITAYRRVRADLRTLDQSFDQDTSSPRVQVDCLLGISGDINKMNLTYDIELHEATDDQSRKVKSLVNTDEIRIKQFAYLIATGAFYSNTSNSGANFSDGMWTSLASSALSAGLNSVFGNMLGDKWELGAEISDQDKRVNASTSFMNNKLKFHANVGYRSENITTSDNSFIGDFDLEYLLNSIWTLKAYSHSNDKFYSRTPTTQGVGIVYMREGSTLKRLFQSFNNRRVQWNKLQNDSIRIKTDSMLVDGKKDAQIQNSVVVDEATKNAPSTATEEERAVEKQPARKDDEKDGN